MMCRLALEVILVSVKHANVCTHFRTKSTVFIYSCSILLVFLVFGRTKLKVTTFQTLRIQSIVTSTYMPLQHVEKFKAWQTCCIVAKLWLDDWCKGEWFSKWSTGIHFVWTDTNWEKHVMFANELHFFVTYLIHRPVASVLNVGYMIFIRVSLLLCLKWPMKIQNKRPKDVYGSRYRALPT